MNGALLLSAPNRQRNCKSYPVCDACVDGFQVELELSKKPATKTGRSTWITPFEEAWGKKYKGYFPIKKSIRPLKKLISEHGEDNVLTSFKEYVRLTDEMFASVPAFANRYGAFEKKAPRKRDTVQEGDTPGW